MNRFENAALKLYNAFNKGELNQNDCSACAVGNLLDGQYMWEGSSNKSSNDVIKKCFRTPISLNGNFNTSDYTVDELSKVEQIFLDSFVGLDSDKELHKDNQYKALMNVLDHLAELDNIKVPEIQIEKFKKVLVS